MLAPQEVQRMLALRALGWGAKRISAELGCSRNTVREALRTIRTYGLIEPKPRVGAVLADRQSAAASGSARLHIERRAPHETP